MTKKKAVSRQRLFQIKQLAKGLCALCPNPRINASHCEVHCKQLRDYQRKYARQRNGYQPWEPGKRGRPPIDR